MAEPWSNLKAAFLALALAAGAAPMFDRPAFAQDNGPRENDGRRRDRGGWAGRRGRDRDGDRNGDRRPDDRPADSPAPQQSTPPATPSASSFGTVSDSERIRQSATETIKANDKNSNGILEGEELSNLGMSRGADKDGDGKITHNELVEFRTPKSTSTATANPTTPAPTTSQPTSKEPAERIIVNKTRKLYRFKSTKDRIDSWKFSSRDANGDGQVSMSEFTRSWNDRTAREFQGYDKDNDGMITPDEAK